MELKPVVVGFVFENKKILLTLDDDNEYKIPGGKLKDNERFQEALKREMKEEIDSKIEIIKFIDTFVRVYKGVKYTMFNYRVKLLSKPRPRNEIKSIGWYDYKDCKKLPLSPDSKHLVKLFHQKGVF